MFLCKSEHCLWCLQRLDEPELKLCLKQLEKQFVKGAKADAAHDDQVCTVLAHAMQQSCSMFVSIVEACRAC